MKVLFHKERGTPDLKHRGRLVRVLQQAVIEAGLEKIPGFLDLIFASRETVISLNENYVHHQGVTDVITFDLREENSQEPLEMQVESTAGEIYVCADIAREWSTVYGQNSPSKELVLYFVHGMLHLAGEDDLTDEARAGMRAAEKRVLTALEQKFSLEGFIN